MLDDNQYATPEKYDARVSINKKFGTNPVSKSRWIFGHFPVKKNLKILELGCGTGLFWQANRDAIPESWTVVLTDYSAGMLEKTKKNLSRTGRNFVYGVMRAENLAYPEKEFDVVLANNMLYHVENRPETVSKISRILKEDGMFIASTMGRNNMAELNGCLYDFLKTTNHHFRFREFSFSLDNGYDQLAPHFRRVMMERYDDMLEINEVEAVIEYFVSYNGMYGNLSVLTDEDAAGFRVYMKKIIDAKGTIQVTKDSGIFICTNS